MLKGVVGASSMGENKPPLKLKYLLLELSRHILFKLNIAVRNLEMYKPDLNFLIS
jgi:hypothetical protein